MQSDRLEQIRLQLLSTGHVRLAEVAVLTGASLATIRRDFVTLEQSGVAQRVHGGLRLIGVTTIEAAFEQRAGQHLASKRAIAAKALEFMQPSTTCFLDAGTTVLQLAKLVRARPVPLRVVTNGLPIAQALVGIDGVEASLLGGRLRAANLSTIGPQAVAALSRLYVDTLFLGAGSVAEAGMICGVDEDEADLNGQMIARSERVYLLVDSSKFGPRLPQIVSKLGHKMHVITDDGLSHSWRERVTSMGAQLTVVDLGLADQSIQTGDGVA